MKSNVMCGRRAYANVSLDWANERIKQKMLINIMDVNETIHQMCIFGVNCHALEGRCDLNGAVWRHSMDLH